MFHDWKVGQQGWVRLRNGKIGRATVCSDIDCVRVDYIKDAHVSWFWISSSEDAGIYSVSQKPAFHHNYIFGLVVVNQ